MKQGTVMNTEDWNQSTKAQQRIPAGQCVLGEMLDLRQLGTPEPYGDHRGDRRRRPAPVLTEAMRSRTGHQRRPNCSICASMSLPPGAPSDANTCTPSASKAGRHRVTDICDTRNRRATCTSRAGDIAAGSTNISTAAKYTCSSLACFAAVNPPPSAYL